MAVVRCAACGAENPPGSEYCQTCARRLDSATQETVAQQRAVALQNQTTAVRWTSIIVSVVVLVIIAVVVVALFATHVLVILPPLMPLSMTHALELAAPAL